MPADAHSYADPALTTVFDGVQPALPAGVIVDVQPSVVDQLVISNTTATPLEVLGLEGQPFLKVSSAGVLADLGSADWYATLGPEAVPMPLHRHQWARVSKGTTWSEFDRRLRPAVDVPAGIRKSGRERILTAWTIPLRYGSKTLTATGHIAFRPVLGGLVVAVTKTPVSVTPLQGELPGLLLKAPSGKDVVVQGGDGLPFLRFHQGTVLANSASRSWRDDRAARAEPTTATGWVRAGSGSTFSWLEPRLRYPRDTPPDPTRRAVVQRWTIPVTVAGTSSAIEGTVTWVPRSLAFSQTHHSERWWLYLLPVLGLGIYVVWRRSRPNRPGART